MFDLSFLPGLHAIEEMMKSAKSKSGLRVVPWPLLILGVLMIFVSFVFFPWVMVRAFGFALFLAPLWLPVLIVGAAWFLWVTLRRSLYIASQNYILLEIKPPRSILKTPLAMETVLAGMHHSPYEGTWYKKYWNGAVRPWWSLEIASFEGQVHFYIWTRAPFRRLIEAQIYSQYPGAQVVEVQDYTKTIATHEEECALWGCDFIHTKPDPYPIKTYVDYGLDKVAEEPEQVDPLSNLVEFMGSMKKGEYLWLQLIIRVNKGEKYHGEKNADGKDFTWKDEAQEEIEKIRKRAGTKSKFFDPTTGKMIETEGFPNPTKGQMESIAAIERNVSKLAFDVGARVIYLARPDKFDPINIAGVVGIFKQFSSEGWNGFRPTRWLTEFDDYPWETNTTRRKRIAKEEIVAAYKRRQYFHEPFAFHDYMTMSTEELATIYHIPSHAVESPGLSRIQSSTSTAPANLPT